MVENIENLLIPPAYHKCRRTHELWKETCFEFFLRLPNSPQYWEFNLSPSGDWNVYHFDDYRKGMKEETRYTYPQLLFASIKQEDALILTGQIDLSAIVSPKQVVEMAVSAVTKFKNGDIIYWALTHPDKEADFHHRDSFTITLD
ncbi:MAG: DOMON-like domain-containing protein [Cyanobacteria bacterium P01_E01_bin.42]